MTGSRIELVAMSEAPAPSPYCKKRRRGIEPMPFPFTSGDIASENRRYPSNDDTSPPRRIDLTRLAFPCHSLAEESHQTAEHRHSRRVDVGARHSETTAALTSPSPRFDHGAHTTPGAVRRRSCETTRP
jgi:hypothetical protein